MSPQTEGRISLALQDYQNHNIRSLRAAAKAYEVSFATLRSRHLGVLARADTPANSLQLTPSEEKVLVQRILNLAAQGLHPQHTLVKDMANIILKSKNPSDPPTVGPNWVTRFVKRHPELSSIYNRKFDYKRAECEDAEVIGAWFKIVQRTVAEYGVLKEDIYNFDETGFQMGVISTSKVVTSSERRGRPRTTQPGNREWATAIEAIGASGWAVPPFIILGAKLHQKKWYDAGLPPTWKIAVSENGWTNDELGYQWIQHFHQHTDPIRKCKWRLLIFDGHSSHQTAQFLAFCLEKHILTLCMPPHSSHICQPLDVSCFGPLKKAYGHQIENKLRLGINHITKEDFLPAFHAAHQQAITLQNIRAGFRASGLVPFHPEAVLSNLSPAQSTPSPRGSQSSWQAQTPHNLPDIKKQPELIIKEARKRRRSSASSGIQPFQQLLKGFETVVHDKALLTAEVAALRAENQYQKQKRARRKGTIQKGGSLSIQEGMERVQSSVLVDPSLVETESGLAEILECTPQGPRARAPKKCSKCRSLGHIARNCTS